MVPPTAGPAAHARQGGAVGNVRVGEPEDERGLALGLLGPQRPRRQRGHRVAADVGLPPRENRAAGDRAEVELSPAATTTATALGQTQTDAHTRTYAGAQASEEGAEDEDIAGERVLRGGHGGGAVGKQEHAALRAEKEGRQRGAYQRYKDARASKAQRP